MANYGVTDLTSTEGVQVAAVGEISSEQVASQLKEISDTIGTVLTEQPDQGPVRLQTVEIALTVGAEGGVWFVAKGSIEASITLTFERVSPEVATMEDVIATGGGN